MSLYTKKGDRGETNLSQGKKVAKNSLIIGAIGGLDELNSILGIVTSFSKDPDLIRKIKFVQDDLFTISSIMGGSDLRFYSSRIKRLEQEIDLLEEKLPRLKHFIFPNGTITASLLHFARAYSRRAERRAVALDRKKKVRPTILVYLNRLSDYLFMLARSTNHQAQVKEEIWTGKASENKRRSQSF